MAFRQLGEICGCGSHVGAVATGASADESALGLAGASGRVGRGFILRVVSEPTFECPPGVDSHEVKGNIVRAMLPFISGHRRRPRVRGTPRRELRAPTAAIEKRCRHRFGAPVFLAPATKCRWVGSLDIASLAGLGASIRAGRLERRFVSGGAEAQLRAHIFCAVRGEGSQRAGG